MQDAFFQRLRLIAASVAGTLTAAALTLVATQPSPTLEDSVYKIQNIEGRGSGTGFLVHTPRGIRLVTNHHVCELAVNGMMFAISKRGQELVRVEAADAQRDLCQLSPAQGGVALTVASKGASMNDAIIVGGHPLGKPYRTTQAVYLGEETVTLGSLAPPEGCPAGTITEQFLFMEICLNFMQLGITSAPIYPGNSGSPVLNTDGEVVGVINAGDNRDHEGAFVPLRELQHFLGTVNK